MITKEEFIDWKNSLATKEVFEKLKERAEFIKEKLINHAGENGLDDYFNRGYLAAFNDLLLTEYEGEDQ